MSILYFSFPALVLAFVTFLVVKAHLGWRRNNRQPLRTVEAVVIDKRVEGRHGLTLDSWNYATFETEAGERVELELSYTEYVALSAGDFGTLRHQGTRYLGFRTERNVLREWTWGDHEQPSAC